MCWFIIALDNGGSPNCRQDFSQTNLDISSLKPQGIVSNTVKPVCNDRLYDKIYYLWFIR